MFWFILLAVIAIGYFVCAIIKDIKEREVSFSSFWLRILTTLLILFVGFWVAFISAAISTAVINEKNYPTRQEAVSTTEILALKDNNLATGRYYLLSGYVNESLHFTYMYETENGLKFSKISSEKCYVDFDSENPRIEKVRTIYENDFANFFALPIDKTIIYVPEGSIATEYEIDLE